MFQWERRGGGGEEEEEEEDEDEEEEEEEWLSILWNFSLYPMNKHWKALNVYSGK